MTSFHHSTTSFLIRPIYFWQRTATEQNREAKEVLPGLWHTHACQSHLPLLQATGSESEWKRISAAVNFSSSNEIINTSLEQAHKTKTKVTAFRQWDFGNDSSVTPGSCSAELHFSQNGHKSHGADTPVSWTPPFQVPQCHLRRGACGQSTFPSKLESSWKKCFWKVKKRLIFIHFHMTALLPIIANTQHLKTPSEKK